TETRKRVSTGDRDDSFGAVYGCDGEPGNSSAVREVPDGGGAGARESVRNRADDPADRIFPEQNEIGDGSQQSHCGELRRTGAEDNGRNADVARSGAKDGECGAGHGLWDRQRRGSGYTCAAPVEAPGPDEA